MINIKDAEERNNTLKTFFIGGTFIMCLWVGIPYLVHTFIDPHFVKLPVHFLRWLGGLFSALGYCLAVWCVMLFIREGKGTPLPFAHPKKLVMKGPYQFVRNPMVLGTILFLVGSAILLESYGVLIYSAALFLVFHMFVLIEERSLEKRFGQAYLDYKKKIPRWWPRFKMV